MSKLILDTNVDVKGFPTTQLTGMNFTGLTRFKGKIIGCGASGIVELGSGDLDNTTAISAWFEIAINDIGMLNQKRLRSVLGSGMFSTGDLHLIVTMDDGAEETYDVETLSGEKQSTFKRYLDRMQRGSHARLKVQNIAGADFAIDALDAVVVLLHGKPYNGTRFDISPRERIGTLVASFVVA
jgi:hypothetical protein